MSCGVGRRCSSNLTLLRLWHRLAAVAPIRPLAWEPPYAAGAGLKRQKKKKKTTIWLNRICGAPAALGRRFNSGQHSGLRSRLWLRSDPWLRNSICHQANKEPLVQKLQVPQTLPGLRAIVSFKLTTPLPGCEVFSL